MLENRKVIITVLEARRILGKVAEGMSDIEIQNIICSYQLIIDVWLDNYEKKVFKGKTLKELIE